jgi:hypothetical protein
MSDIQWTPVNRMLTYGQGAAHEYRVRENANGTAVLITNGPAGDAGDPFSRREECDDVDAARALADQWESEATQ